MDMTVKIETAAACAACGRIAGQSRLPDAHGTRRDEQARTLRRSAGSARTQNRSIPLRERSSCCATRPPVALLPESVDFDSSALPERM